MARRETVLVTGGAGYIGSHAVLALRAAGYPVIVLDDLSTGQRFLVPDGVPLVVGNVGDSALVKATIREHAIAAVMHFAGSIVVPESVADPVKYYRNNTAHALELIGAAVECGIRAFLFSSTAAVYGEPERIPVHETDRTRPINPYGWSKLFVEQMLMDAAAAHPRFRPAALRYFNVAGADPQGRAGQAGKESTHLIKVAMETALGIRERMDIFGTDYPTADGTCVRDYIHVSDLADAHVQTLAYLLDGGAPTIMNCGYGHGFSVTEVIETAERTLGRLIPRRTVGRRPGDSPALVSDNRRIRETLGWTPRFDDLATIIRSAFAWEQGLQERRRQTAA